MTKTVGILLIVIGLVALAWGGFSYTTKEKAVDLGPVEITKETRKTIPLPPVAGAIALVAGIALIATSKSTA